MTVPLIICAWVCSGVLMTLSVATGLMVTTGGVASTNATRETLLGLPATSFTLAVTVVLPSASAPTLAAGTVTLQVPSDCTTP